MMEEEYWIKTSRLVSSHVAVGAANGRRVVSPPLVETPDSKMNCVMRTLQRNDVMARRILTMILDPLILRCRVRKDCVVRRKETSQNSSPNRVRVWPPCTFRVVRNFDSAQQPFDHIIVEYRDILSMIWERRIMHLCFFRVCRGSDQT